ncbi:MAG TPA: WYL domain-containing protein [Acidimicrobiales bacterium]|nr:WYL domain-containing protein [Acidimicrobiales bacterium]
MTTIAIRPPAWDTLEEALRQRRPVRLTYHGRWRTVCPHALGWKNNKAMLLAYQTGGHTDVGAQTDEPRPGWRNLFVDDIGHAALADPDTTWETADNYNASHPFNSIDHLSIAIKPGDPQGT